MVKACWQDGSGLSNLSDGIPENRNKFRIFRGKFAQIPIDVFDLYARCTTALPTKKDFW